MKKLIFLLLLFASLSTPAFIKAAGDGEGSGGTSSHGGDIISHKQAFNWFKNSERKIHYCVKVAKDFPIEEDKVLHVIYDSFRKWLRYLNNRAQDFEVAAGIKPISCDNLVTDVDLTFYIGVENNVIKHERTHFLKPLGFAHEQGYNVKEKWGKGLIWIDNKPKVFENAENFDTIITHEIGHVFGAHHVPGTIMDENIAIDILNNNVVLKENGIDGKAELLTCSSMNPCKRVQMEEISVKNDVTTLAESVSLLDDKYTKVEMFSDMKTKEKNEITFYFSSEDHYLPIKVDISHKSFMTRGISFSSIDDKGNAKNIRNYGVVYNGSMKDSAGVEYRIYIYRNIVPSSFLRVEFDEAPEVYTKDQLKNF